MRIIDISVLVDDKTIIWPGNKSPQIKRLSDMKKGDAHNETSQMDPSIFVGPAFVVSLPSIKEIKSSDLEKVRLPLGVQRVLFKTSNSSLWNKKNSKFTKDYVGLTPGAASWLARHKIKLVGMDYLSIAKFADVVTVHQILFKAEVAILEGLNLNKAKKGKYQLICLPIKIANAEAGSVRAVLLTK